MKTNPAKSVRPNPRGELPQIDPTAYVDPTAQLIGPVKIGPGVFIGPNVVIRADEVDENGQVQPIVVEAQCNVQDGVIIHALAGTPVQIGSRTSLAHSSIVHGPCILGQQCFVGFGAILFHVKAENDVFVSTRAVVQEVDLPANTFVPPGSSVLCQNDVAKLSPTQTCQREFMKKTVQANIKLAEGYLHPRQLT